MSEFNKNSWNEFNEEEKNYTESSANDFNDKVIDSVEAEPINEEPQIIWNKDDYQGSLVKAQYNYSEKKKKNKFSAKKYVAIAVAAAIINMAALGGIFGAGYYFGQSKTANVSKNETIANMNNETQGVEQTVQTGPELSTVEISKKVGPAVVGITSQIESGMSIFGTTTVSEGTGSGIIISEDGYVITNNHVVEGASKVTVTLNTGSEYDAKIIGTDDKTDLAVIKFEPSETLTVAELGDSTQVQVGEKAVAIGNPLGLEFFGSTTEGIISAVNRTITVEDKTMNVIQTDAAINNGNSGGALVNAYGQVIGINTVKISSSVAEGMGFAIPISEAKPVISDLMQYGYVKGRPVIGISSRDVTEYMSARQGWPIGVQVMSVTEGSGAEVAGLEQGDIIVKADGQEITSVDDLNEIKDSHQPGEFIEVEVYKYSTGLTETVKIQLGEERP